MFSVDIVDTPTVVDIVDLDVNAKAGGTNAAYVVTLEDVVIQDSTVTIRSIVKTGLPTIAAIEIIPVSIS